MLTNFNMLTVFYIKSCVFLYQIVQPLQDHCFELIDPNNLQKQNFTVVGTQGSIQFICWPIALHSNILSLAKSLIGIGTVRLTPILLPLISETSCFLGLLLTCHIRNPVGSLSVQQVSLTLNLTALIDLHLLD